MAWADKSAIVGRMVVPAASTLAQDLAHANRAVPEAVAAYARPLRAYLIVHF